MQFTVSNQITVPQCHLDARNKYPHTHCEIISRNENRSKQYTCSINCKKLKNTAIEYVRRCGRRCVCVVLFVKFVQPPRVHKSMRKGKPKFCDKIPKYHGPQNCAARGTSNCRRQQQQSKNVQMCSAPLKCAGLC